MAGHIADEVQLLDIFVASQQPRQALAGFFCKVF